VRELVRAALRMRPDRLVVGEVRGGEALDMLQACNTGHDGSLSTVHANSAADALARLETLTLFSGVALPLAAVRAQLAAAIDAIVQVARGEHGRREIVTVAEVQPGRVPQARALLTRVGPAVEPMNAPTRPPRRRGVDLEEVWHACAPSSSR
jgi:Flp pilus assembly CpaF family ATPase